MPMICSHKALGRSPLILICLIHDASRGRWRYAVFRMRRKNGGDFFETKSSLSGLLVECVDNLSYSLAAKPLEDDVDGVDVMYKQKVGIENRNAF